MSTPATWVACGVCPVAIRSSRIRTQASSEKSTQPRTVASMVRVGYAGRVLGVVVLTWLGRGATACGDGDELAAPDGGGATGGSESLGGSSGRGGTFGTGGNGGSAVGGTLGTSAGGRGAASSGTGGSLSTGGGAGQAGALGMSGAAGEGGAPSLDCSSFPNPNDQQSCDPKLRAIVTRGAKPKLTTFEYDAEGRLLSVGDERSHDEYWSHRYSYEQQRLSQYEAYDEERETRQTYEFAYRDTGMLLSMNLVTESPRSTSRERTEYNDVGDPVEIWSGNTRVRRYVYRANGQVDSDMDYLVGSSGVETPILTREYSYTEDGLLESIVGTTVDGYGDSWVDDFEEGFTYREGKLVSSYYSSFLYDRGVSYDGREQAAFMYEWTDGDSGGESISGFADNHPVFVYCCFGLAEQRHVVTPPHQMFPFQPYSFAITDDLDMPFEWGSWSRSFSADANGLVESITFSHDDGSGDIDTLDVDVLRCDGVVAEITHTSQPDRPTVTRAYYYGCDDFMLPGL